MAHAGLLETADLPCRRRKQICPRWAALVTAPSLHAAKGSRFVFIWLSLWFPIPRPSISESSAASRWEASPSPCPLAFLQPLSEDSWAVSPMASLLLAHPMSCFATPTCFAACGGLSSKLRCPPCCPMCRCFPSSSSSPQFLSRSLLLAVCSSRHYKNYFHT